MRSKDLLERILWLGGTSQTWDVRSKQHLTETCQWHYAEPWAPIIKVCYDHDQMTQIRNNSTHSQLNTIKYLLSKATMYMYGLMDIHVLDSNSTFYGTGTRIIMQCMLIVIHTQCTDTYTYMYRQLRARRVLSLFKNVPLRTRRVLQYHHRLCSATGLSQFWTEHLWMLIAPFWLSTDYITFYLTRPTNLYRSINVHLHRFSTNLF